MLTLLHSLFSSYISFHLLYLLFLNFTKIFPFCQTQITSIFQFSILYSSLKLLSLLQYFSMCSISSAILHSSHSHLAYLLHISSAFCTAPAIYLIVIALTFSVIPNLGPPNLILTCLYIIVGISGHHPFSFFPFQCSHYLQIKFTSLTFIFTI